MQNVLDLWFRHPGFLPLFGGVYFFVYGVWKKLCNEKKVDPLLWLCGLALIIAGASAPPYLSGSGMAVFVTAMIAATICYYVTLVKQRARS